MEFDWVGIDVNGHLAIFSSLNTAYTPACVTTSFKLYNELVSFVDVLAKTSSAIKVSNGKGNYSDWKKFAQKGLFGYDNENIHSTTNPDRYRLLYKPQTPIIAKYISVLRKFETIIPTFNITFSDFLTFEEMKKSLQA